MSNVKPSSVGNCTQSGPFYELGGRRCTNLLTVHKDRRLMRKPENAIGKSTFERYGHMYNVYKVKLIFATFVFIFEYNRGFRKL